MQKPSINAYIYTILCPYGAYFSVNLCLIKSLHTSNIQKTWGQGVFIPTESISLSVVKLSWSKLAVCKVLNGNNFAHEPLTSHLKLWFVDFSDPTVVHNLMPRCTTSERVMIWSLHVQCVLSAFTLAFTAVQFYINCQQHIQVTVLFAHKHLTCATMSVHLHVHVCMLTCMYVRGVCAYSAFIHTNEQQ